MTALHALALALLALQGAFLAALAALAAARRDRASLWSDGTGSAGMRGPVEDLARSGRWWRRAAAARQSGRIARLGDRELLARMLDDPHPAVQSAASASLAPLRDLATVENLLDRLSERAMLVRLQQFRLLHEALPLATPALVRRLVADAPPRRLKAWIALVEGSGSAELLAHVATLHSHPDPLIRLSVARALKRHRSADTEEILLIALHDHDWRVRAVAARSLGTQGNPGAVPRLAAGLRDVRWWVRFRCGLALAQLGPAGREALEAARRDVDRYAGEMATMVAGLSPDSVAELAEG